MNANGDSTELKPKTDKFTWVDLVCNQVNSLHFGTIQITVHDSRVVQIERTEKVRLDRKPFGS